jgi:SagB-type dehydrogenase family enzyme
MMTGYSRLSLMLLTLIAFLLLANGCASASDTSAESPSATKSDQITLPSPRQTGDMPLEEVIGARRSVREFAGQELSWEEIAQLLWAAQGETDPRGLRAAPSAGALYPLEIYVALPDGVYHYLPQGHTIERVTDRDVREDLWQAGLKQEALRQAPAVFVVTAVYERTEAKYGERAERYVHLEAGHAAQNLLLQAVALDLGAVPVGAFYDDQVVDVLGLPSDHRPLYLVPVGHPEN